MCLTLLAGAEHPAERLKPGGARDRPFATAASSAHSGAASSCRQPRGQSSVMARRSSKAAMIRSPADVAEAERSDARGVDHPGVA